jgi:D-glycero-D-manno-heptose 1,7-bisphosphate phosphatase
MGDGLSAAVFIDRDGTIMEDTDYCSQPKDVRIFPGVLEALQLLKSREFKLIIITNQSGIGRGLFTLDQYRAVESEVLRQLGKGLVDATYYSPDAPGIDSKCR